MSAIAGGGATDPGFQYNIPTQQAWSQHQNMIGDRFQNQANAYANMRGSEAGFFQNKANQQRQLAQRHMPTREEAFASYQDRPKSPTFFGVGNTPPTAGGARSPMTGLTGQGQQTAMATPGGMGNAMPRPMGYNGGMVPQGMTMGSSQQQGMSPYGGINPQMLQQLRQQAAMVGQQQQGMPYNQQAMLAQQFNNLVRQQQMMQGYGQQQPVYQQQAPGFQYNPMAGLY